MKVRRRQCLTRSSGFAGEGLQDLTHVRGGSVLLDVELLGDRVLGVARKTSGGVQSTRRSINVATVLRNVCGVTQSNPVSARIARHRRSMLPTWCQVPFRVAKTALWWFRRTLFCWEFPRARFYKKCNAPSSPFCRRPFPLSRHLPAGAIRPIRRAAGDYDAPRTRQWDQVHHHLVICRLSIFRRQQNLRRFFCYFFKDLISSPVQQFCDIRGRGITVFTAFDDIGHPVERLRIGHLL